MRLRPWIAKKIDALKPTVHRGWRKRMILLKMNLQSIVRRLRGRLKNGGVDNRRK